MTNQKLLDMMTKEGYYQKNVIRIARYLFDHEFSIMGIERKCITLVLDFGEYYMLAVMHSFSVHIVVSVGAAKAIGFDIRSVKQILDFL